MPGRARLSRLRAMHQHSGRLRLFAALQHRLVLQHRHEELSGRGRVSVGQTRLCSGYSQVRFLSLKRFAHASPRSCGIHAEKFLTRRCVNTNGSFVCELIPPCKRGFRRAFNGTCLDIDECSESLHNCRLDLHQYCVNKEGSFECLTRLPSCPSGYQYSLGTRQCEDIDECLTGRYTCDARHLERCVNLPGTYRCVKSQSKRLSECADECNDRRFEKDYTYRIICMLF